VQFELLMGVGDLTLSPFRVVLNQIPPVEPLEEDKPKAGPEEEKTKRAG
jgi:hypothetical protein